jgi:large subunit ribosomal protein L10
MSKPIKQLVRKELLKRLDGADSLAIVGFTGVNAITNNIVRNRLAEKKIRLMVVKNSLARQAFKEMGIADAGNLLEGPCAVAFGADSVVEVVRELLEINKDTPSLVVKGAYMEGTVFPTDQVEALSKYPTRSEAIAKVVACVVGPASKLAGVLKSPSGKLASILKTIEDKAKDSAGAAPAEAPAA